MTLSYDDYCDAMDDSYDTDVTVEVERDRHPTDGAFYLHGEVKVDALYAVLSQYTPAVLKGLDDAHEAAFNVIDNIDATEAQDMVYGVVEASGHAARYIGEFKTLYEALATSEAPTRAMLNARDVALTKYVAQDAYLHDAKVALATFQANEA